jgi:vitamin B12 transporter
MRRLVLMTTALLAAAPAHAQQAIPETIVTTTRVPTPAERVAAAITVLDRQTIEERGYVTLADALRAIPGVHLVQQGAAGQVASAFLRGTESRHVLVLLDGVPINDPSTPSGAFNFGNELLGDIERIEVLRGPGSSLYGSGAIGGVINMVTRRAAAGRGAFQPFGELAGGTQNTLRGVAGLAGERGGVDWLAVGQSLSTRGFDATPPRFTRDTGELDGLRAHAATTRLGWQIAPDTRIEGFLRWRENVSGLDDVPNDDPNYDADDRRWFGQLRFETRPIEPWFTGIRVARTEDRRRYLNLPHAGSTVRTDDIFRGDRTTYDWGNQVRLPSAGALSDAFLTFGFTHEEESVEQLSGSPTFRTRVDATQSSDALFAGLQFRLFERLDLSGGVRRDQPEDFDGAGTWRLGAVLDVPEVLSRVRLAAGTGFRAPALFQRFGRIGTFFQGNPNLLPEQSTSWEAGFETDVPAAGQPRFASFGATYFHSLIRDLIAFNRSFTSLENIDRAKIEGVELFVTLRPASWLEVTGSWTWTDARNRANDQRLARRPENVASLVARIAPHERVVIAPELLFVGPSPETASYANSGAFLSGLRYNRSGTLVNLTASFRATEEVTLFAEARNLLNTRFEPANGFAYPGPSLLVGTRFAL